MLEQFWENAPASGALLFFVEEKDPAHAHITFNIITAPVFGFNYSPVLF
jgi:hypothetical protein